MRFYELAKAAVREFLRADMLHHAAAMTFYTVLAFLPALLSLVALLGLLGASQTGPAIAEWLADNGISSGVAEAIRGIVDTATRAGAGAVSLPLVIAVFIALNASARAFETAGRAMNELFGVEETRSWGRRRLQAVIGALVVLSLALSARLIFFSGELAVSEASDLLGLNSAAAAIWRVISLALVFVLSVAAYAWVYWFAPNITSRYVRMLSAGAVFAVAIWMAASGLFFLYASNFSKINAAYGGFAAAVILLIWFWLTNSAFLFGAAINLALREEAHHGFEARGRASFWPRLLRGKRKALDTEGEDRASRIGSEPPAGPDRDRRLDRDSAI